LGLFGGTFDPPHIGHLIAAQDALTALSLDRVIFIPAGLPPHKQERAITPPEIRAALVRAAIEGDARFALDERELSRAGPSYTVDTLREYRAAHPEAELYLLLGVDQYAELHTWRDPAEVAALSRLAILDRAGAAGRTGNEGAVERVAVTRIDIASTEIRRRVQAGEPIRYFVPPAVEVLIRQARLYGGGDGTADGGVAERAGKRQNAPESTG
jgi:nicotinate-nucleotide adenylyltransferase